MRINASTRKHPNRRIGSDQPNTARQTPSCHIIVSNETNTRDRELRAGSPTTVRQYEHYSPQPCKPVLATLNGPTVPVPPPSDLGYLKPMPYKSTLHTVGTHELRYRDAAMSLVLWCINSNPKEDALSSNGCTAVVEHSHPLRRKDSWSVGWMLPQKQDVINTAEITISSFWLSHDNCRRRRNYKWRLEKRENK